MKDQNDFFDDMIDLDDEFESNDPALESALGEFDDEGDEEDEEEPIDVRTVIMSKNGMIALLSLKTFSTGGQVVRVDPRQSIPTAQNYDDGEAAKAWFRRSIATSVRNGWTVAYDGEPLFG